MGPRLHSTGGGSIPWRSWRRSLKALPLCVLLGLLLTASVLYPLVLGSGDWVADGPQVLEYVHASGQGRGAWYLNWPGTFGVTRIRLPMYWRVLRTRDAQGPVDGRSLPNHAESAHLNSGAET